MEPHQRLEVFLPKLLAALERKGLSEAAVVFAWKSVMAGSKQPPIRLGSCGVVQCAYSPNLCLRGRLQGATRASAVKPRRARRDRWPHGERVRG